MKFAQAEVAGGFLGVDVDLSKVVGDGNTLTLGTKTFTFTMSATKSSINGSTITLDSRVSASQQIADAVNLLSQNANFPGNMHVSAKNGTTIHVDAAASNSFADKASFASAISANVASAPAKNAGTKLAIKDSEIKDGNVISVGSNKFEAGKDFTDAASLKTALEAKGYTVESAAGNDGKTVLTIRAKLDPATASVGTAPAPTVLGKGLTLQIGDTSDSWNQLNVAVQDMHSASIGVGNLKIDTEEAAQAAINKIKAAINTVSDVRGTLGATQNRLDHTINNLSVMTENIQDAESTIRDTDVAEEMMAYTKNNILIQSAQAMLAQANQVPQGVLQLLQ